MSRNGKIALGLMALCGGADVSAQSSIDIYGIADIGIDYVNNQNGGVNRYVRNSNVSGSRLGFRGGEQLSDGRRLIYQFESGVAIDTGEQSSSTTLFNRQAWIGVSDERYGTVTAGRQYTPYYWLLGPDSAPARMGGSFGARAGDIDALDQASRVNNAVSYVTPAPSGAGLQWGLLVAAGEAAGRTARGGAYSAAVKYQAGAWDMALGRQVFQNGASRTGWDAGAAASFIKTPVSNGYLSAAAIHYTAVAVQHEMHEAAHAGHTMLGATVSNVQFRPDGQSLFAATASFDSVEAHGSWMATDALCLLATANYTRERAANGITAPANYRQVSTEQSYALSKRTSLYLLEGLQWARGQTLGTGGRPVAALAVVGDAQTPASARRQYMLSLGIRHTF